MELYANYCKEMYGRDIISDEHGFIVYKAYEDRSLYIHAIYVNEGKRQDGHAYKLEKAVIDKENPSSVFCYVDLTTNNPDLSLSVILAAGYKVFNTTSESIMLKKEM